MKSTIFTSILLFTVSVLSAPAATRVFLPRFDLNRTAAFTSSPTETIAPSLQVRWKSRDGSKFASNDRGGHLLNNPNEKVHTAVYFNLSPEQARLGKTCKLVFRLSMDDWAISQSPVTPPQFDLYRLNGCLNDKYSWNNKVLRGAHAGILTPVKGAAADWRSVDMSADTIIPKMGAAPTFTCEAGEYSFEMIARPGVNIGWTSGRGSGLSIETCG